MPQRFLFVCLALLLLLRLSDRALLAYYTTNYSHLKRHILGNANINLFVDMVSFNLDTPNYYKTVTLMTNLCTKYNFMVEPKDHY